MGEWKKTQCNLCAVACGIEVKVENNKIIDVRPDKTSPQSRGYCCRKGRSAKYFVDHEDRLLYPKKRVGDHYERISWEQAYKEIAEKANSIIKKHGPRSFALIGGGNPSVQTPSATALPLLKGIGSQYVFNAIGTEFMGYWWSCGRILGDQMHYLEPDDRNIEVIIYWGSNSYVSHQMPFARETCRQFSESADKMMIVIDPRLSETARMSDMHIMPALGSDSLFIRALISLILEKGWQNQKRDGKIKNL
ncbi:molybdopterin-dependent oxidoreductase [Intestinibacter sp.]